MSPIDRRSIRNIDCAEVVAGGRRLLLADPASSCDLLLATPATAEHTWRVYLEGARAVYTSWGVHGALDFPAVASGSSTKFFIAAMAGERCVGGVRIQGPYSQADESHALAEWACSSGRQHLKRALDARLPEGVVEVKTAWVDPDFYDRTSVARVLGNVAPLILAESGCRYLLATSAEHSLRGWQAGGGRLDGSVPAAAYPDERYRTRVMWWDAESVIDDAVPSQGHVMAEMVRRLRQAAVGGGQERTA